MGKYDAYVKVNPNATKKKKVIHPIWRGIGFILAIAVPFFSYILALQIFQQNFNRHWFPLPTDILSPWGSDPYIFIKLGIALVIIFAISVVLMLITFVVNALFGPPRYGPLDSPPIRREEKPRYTKR
jgi:hypothetical protein